MTERKIALVAKPHTEREAELIGRAIGQMQHRYTVNVAEGTAECQCQWEGVEDLVGEHVEKYAQRLGKEADDARLDGEPQWTEFLLRHGATK